MKRKTNEQKLKKQKKEEILAIRKQLNASGKPLNKLTLEELETELNFMKYIMRIELDQGPTIAQNLIESGVSLPAPDTLNDVEIIEKLREVIEGLADLCHFLKRTDHLSDRELYHFLWSDLLNEKTSEMGAGNYIMAEEHDVVGDESEAFFKYYGEIEDLDYFACLYPDKEPPVREPLPYDRDKNLPSPFEKAA